MSTEPLIKINNLTTQFRTDAGLLTAVDGISFTINRGEVFSIVGESGSGKSVTALSMVDLIDPPGEVVDGEIWYHSPELANEHRTELPAAVDGEYVDLRQLDVTGRRALRGTEFAMIFQDPMSSFNPSLTVGEQIAEAVEVQRRAKANPRAVRSRTQGYGLTAFVTESILPSRSYLTTKSRERAVDLLDQVGIPDPEDRVNEYPHEFSGGMLQRAMIAQALAGEPTVLIADEPTTALDVTIQAQVLDLLSELQLTEDMTILLITHNLGVVARMSDRLGVMYAGNLVERGTLEDIFSEPVHPYTTGLLGSIPDFDGAHSRLQPIPGTVPSLLETKRTERCQFADRCPQVMNTCLEEPPQIQVNPDHSAKCYLAKESYDPTQALPEGYFDDN